jgi:hypothetical protein
LFHRNLTGGSTHQTEISGVPIETKLFRGLFEGACEKYTRYRAETIAPGRRPFGLPMNISPA